MFQFLYFCFAIRCDSFLFFFSKLTREKEWIKKQTISNVCSIEWTSCCFCGWPFSSCHLQNSHLFSILYNVNHRVPSTSILIPFLFVQLYHPVLHQPNIKVSKNVSFEKFLLFFYWNTCHRSRRTYNLKGSTFLSNFTRQSVTNSEPVRKMYKCNQWNFIRS